MKRLIKVTILLVFLAMMTQCAQEIYMNRVKRRLVEDYIEHLDNELKFQLDKFKESEQNNKELWKKEKN